MMRLQDRIDEDAEQRAGAKSLIMDLIKDNRLLMGDPNEYGVIFEGMTIPRYKPWNGGNEYHTALSDERFNMIQQLVVGLPAGSVAVEMGVFTGGVTKFFLDQKLEAWAFDTFKGVAGADGEHDLHTDGDYCSPDGVLDYIKGAKVVRGEIPNTLDIVRLADIRIAHIDLDVYQPTKHALSWVYDRLHPDGVIVVDDYGFASTPGVREAVDEFKYGRKLYIPTGQMIIWHKGETY